MRDMNTKLKKLISIPKDEASCEEDSALVEELKKAQLIMPIEITSYSENIDEHLQFRPLKIADENENILIPLFSDDEELIKLNIECNAINIYSKNLAEMISETQEYDSIAINPFSEFSLTIPLKDFVELF